MDESTAGRLSMPAYTDYANARCCSWSDDGENFRGIQVTMTERHGPRSAY